MARQSLSPPLKQTVVRKKRKAVLLTKSVKDSKQVPRALDFDRADPRAAGIDPAMIHGYEEAMQGMVRHGVIAGCASMVLLRGQVVQAGGFGYADLELKTKFRTDTLCRLFCMTKSYVAVAFMSLVDEGRVSLEDRLDKYLPEFSEMYVTLARTRLERPILMKHLLSHTSGIDYAVDIDTEPEDEAAASYLALQAAVQRGSVRTLKEFCEGLAKLPLSCQPGQGYHYGFSLDVLGRVLEVLLGKPLDECLRERVFEPLEMRDTHWAVPDTQLHRLAGLYANASTWGHLYGGTAAVPVTTRNGLVRIDGNRAEESHWREGQQCPVICGGGFMGYLYGGLLSTVADTARFVQMLMDHGVGHNGRRILHERTVRLMERDRLKPAWGSGRACYVGNKGVFLEGDEYGMGGAACTYWSVDRAHGLATVWFTQNVSMPEFEELKVVDPENADLWKVLYRAVHKEAKVTSPKQKRSEQEPTPSPIKRQRSQVG